MDTYEPEFKNEETSVNRTNEIIEVNFPKAEDVGKEFDYYVKAIGEGTGIEVTSETIQVNQISGVEGYSYVMDNSPNTKPNNKVDLKETTLILPNDRSQRRYLHISAVDYQGNVSEPLHIDLSESYYRVDGNLFMDLDGDGVRTSEEPWIGNHEVSLVGIYGEQLKDLNGEPYKTVTDSNGYYRFDVFTGGSLRLKVEPLEDRRFTKVPEDASGSNIYNQITNPLQGLTDIFEVNDKRTQVTRNAGFTYRDLDYKVEHVNIDTGNNITEYNDGVLDGITTRETRLRPLATSQLPQGYTYTNQFRVNEGSVVRGTSYNLNYEDFTVDVTVTFYYTFEGTTDTTKRFQGDNTGSPLPFDSYTNSGLYTKRDAQGNVTETGMNINSTFVLDEYEAPIAMIPRNINLQVLDNSGNAIHTEDKNLGNNNIILNTGYLDDLRVTSRFGDSRDANSTSERVRITNYQEPTYKRIDIKDSGMKGVSEVRESAITDTNATLGVNEDSNYIGRWVNQPLDITYWTPEGVGGISTQLEGEELINRANTIQTSYEVDVYNILQHHYEPRIGSDDIEYFEYIGSTLKQGYYPYNSSGEQSSVIRDRNTSVIQTTYVDVRDIEVGSYINAEGFTVNNNQITPVQRQVATEVIDDGGQTLTGHQTDSVSGGGINPVEEGGSGNSPQVADDRTIINYYEELAYVPYSTEEELITQQAVPVGGRIHYVDPYDYVVLPSYNQLTVNEESGKLITDIQDNVEEFNDTGYYHSEVVYTEEQSGVYVSDVDDYTSFEQSIPDATSQNKQHMDNVLRDGNEVSSTKYNETPNYITYINNSIDTVYLPVGAVQASTHLDYRLPLTYSHNTKEMLLKDVVAVGKDTGFPVYGHPDIIGEVYKMNYRSEVGEYPSTTDKLITTNKGSIYLVPLNKQGQTLDDEYKVREYIDKVGTSQVSIVNDKSYTIDKYLYGRGDNVIYSGQRKEVEVEDNFTADQMVTKDATPEEVTRNLGIRTTNNKEINEKVLDDE